ncbi:MAG: hypothetical protein KJO31_12925 [Gammaproteobacteria bacterium]|nr:hypothetical protein [Gammaproteobacteria bacterium]
MLAKNRNVPDYAFLVVLLLLLGTTTASGQQSPREILDQVWSQARENVYPPSLTETHFTAERLGALRKRAAKVADVYALTPLINEFLAQLGVSHTRFYDNHSVEFYFFRSLFGTRDPDQPAINHIGAFFATDGGYYVVRETLNGYPAERAGLRRGDVVVRANGEVFHPFLSFNPAAGPVKLEVRRNTDRFEVPVSPVSENPNRSLANAIANSAKTFSRNGKRIGYIRLWSGTGAAHLAAYRESVADHLMASDAVVLDLRGGFGGAWYEYADPFFADRSGYFRFSVVNRDGVQAFEPPQQDNDKYFAGPMAVLIDDGTRSGKEGVAYLFQRAGRAPLIGRTTAGAFSAGMGIFNDSSLPYFLCLSVAEYMLDGRKVEGVGIEPDVVVEYPLDRSLDSDPQLEAALDLLAR